MALDRRQATHPIANEDSSLSSNIHVHRHVDIGLLLIERKVSTRPDGVPPILRQRTLQLVQPITLLIG